MSVASSEPRPTERTKRLLFGSATHCGFPGCHKKLIFRFGDLLTIVVDIAHIRSGLPAGPRHVPDYGPVREFANLLLLCSKHHRLIDDHPEDFPIGTLEDWKEAQVSEAGTPLAADLVASLRLQISELAGELGTIASPAPNRNASVQLLCGRGSLSDAVMLPLANYRRVTFEDVVSIVYLGIEVRHHEPLHVRQAGLEFAFDDAPSAVYLPPELKHCGAGLEVRLIDQKELRDSMVRLARTTNRLPQRFRGFVELSDDRQVRSEWTPMLDLPIWRDDITDADLLRLARQPVAPPS